MSARAACARWARPHLPPLEVRGEPILAQSPPGAPAAATQSPTAGEQAQTAAGREGHARNERLRIGQKRLCRVLPPGIPAQALDLHDGVPRRFFGMKEPAGVSQVGLIGRWPPTGHAPPRGSPSHARRSSSSRLSFPMSRAFGPGVFLAAFTACRRGVSRFWRSRAGSRISSTKCGASRWPAVGKPSAFTPRGPGQARDRGHVRRLHVAGNDVCLVLLPAGGPGEGIHHHGLGHGGAAGDVGACEARGVGVHDVPTGYPRPPA